MKIVLNDGILEYKGKDANLIKCCSGLIRNYMRDFCTDNIEIRYITVKEFDEWYKETTLYIKKKKNTRTTTTTNEYLCGIARDKDLLENITEIRDDEVTECMMEYLHPWNF